MNHLKIGLILDDSLDKPDGIQQYVLSVGGWLSAQGHDVHYLVGETKRTDIHGVHSLSRNVKARFNGNRLSIPLPTSRNKLRQFMAEQQFDVLHVQVPYSPWLAHHLISAAGPETAVIGTFHVVGYPGLVKTATKGLAIWTRSSLKRFDKIISVSSAAQTYALQTYGIASDIIPNTFDFRRFHDAKPLTQYDDDRITILFVGRLVERKGCLILLQAIAELLAIDPVLPKLRVLIGGKGHLLATLEQFVADNHLGDIVTFTGFVDEDIKPALYASADISVFPSTGGESFGIVLIEAIASGRAVVLAGDNVGYHSVLESQPDLLFPVRDPSALAAKLAKYLHDPAARKQMAAWGAKYSAGFDTETVGRQLLHEYNQALHKRRTP